MAKILVVDDNVGILEAMQAMLELDGHEVSLSQFGNDALNKLDGGYCPDVILLDVLLSGDDGRDICKKIKSQPETKDIPIIMVSAHPSAMNNIEASGANDFMAKPFQISELLAKVYEYTNNNLK